MSDSLVWNKIDRACGDQRPDGSLRVGAVTGRRFGLLAEVKCAARRHAALEVRLPYAQQPRAGSPHPGHGGGGGAEDLGLRFDACRRARRACARPARSQVLRPGDQLTDLVRRAGGLDIGPDQAVKAAGEPSGNLSSFVIRPSSIWYPGSN
jgi:hypothetical protein